MSASVYAQILEPFSKIEFLEMSYESYYNAEFLNNNRLTQEDDMMSRMPLRICHDPNYEFKIQTRTTFLLRDDILKGKNNCNLWHIFRRVQDFINLVNYI